MKIFFLRIFTKDAKTEAKTTLRNGKYTPIPGMVIHKTIAQINPIRFDLCECLSLSIRI